MNQLNAANNVNERRQNEAYSAQQTLLQALCRIIRISNGRNLSVAPN